MYYAYKKENVTCQFSWLRDQSKISIVHILEIRPKIQRKLWAQISTTQCVKMGRCLLSSTISSLRICQLPRIRLPVFPKSRSTNSQYGFCTSLSTGGGFCTKAALSEVGIKKEYSKVAADSTGSIPSSELLKVVEAAAKTGAQVWLPFLIWFYFYVLGNFLLKDWILSSCLQCTTY